MVSRVSQKALLNQVQHVNERLAKWFPDNPRRFAWDYDHVITIVAKEGDHPLTGTEIARGTTGELSKTLYSITDTLMRMFYNPKPE